MNEHMSWCTGRHEDGDCLIRRTRNDGNLRVDLKGQRESHTYIEVAAAADDITELDWLIAKLQDMRSTLQASQAEI